MVLPPTGKEGKSWNGLRDWLDAGGVSTRWMVLCPELNRWVRGRDAMPHAVRC